MRLPRRLPTGLPRRRATSAQVALGAMLILTLVATGCAGSQPKAVPVVKPKVAPSAIAKAGVLKAGVDLTYPPFGGVDNGKKAGIDVDVARALASELGLKVEIMGLPLSAAAAALASGTVDIVFSVPIDASTVTSFSIAGSYIADGPAFFTRVATPTASATSTAAPTTTAPTASLGAVATTLTLDTVGQRLVGAQTGSEAYWMLKHSLDPDQVIGFTTLRAAFGALVDRKIDVVAGDAVVGSYIARDFPGVEYAGQLAPARRLAAAVAKTNATLSDAVAKALSDLSVDGVLKTIRTTWAGSLPELELAQIESSEASAAAEAPPPAP